MLKNWRQNHRGQWKRQKITITSNEPYTYTPLDEASQNIRVLTLLPGRFSTPINAYLKVERLSSENIPEFEALSYTWGSEDNPVELKIESETDNRRLLITAGLAEALRHLRYKRRPRQLWIDAVCIDQQNIPERNFQITRMGDIYSLSKRVVVWLGPEKAYSSLGIECIKRLAAKIEVDWLTSRMKLKKSIISAPLGEYEYKLSYNVDEVIGIDMILLRPWFERLWIWQEIWLARPGALLICGKQSILWSAFRMAVFPLLNLARLRISLFTSRRKNLLTDLCSMISPRGFQRLIHCTRYSKCSDPRDRIFALRSLLDDSDHLKRMKPDYNKTASEIYREVFLFVSQGIGHLSLIEGCQLDSAAQSSLPSWVPDWSTPPQTKMLSSSYASGNSFCWIEVAEENQMHVGGFKIATVQKVARHSLPLERMRPDKINAIRELASKHELQPSQYEAFARTLFADCLLKNSYWPGEGRDSNLDYPTLQNVIFTVYTILSGNENSFPIPWGLPQNADRIADNIEGRLLYTTSDGTFGLAPNCTQPGDVIVVLLGLDQCLVLRPVKDIIHQVVGVAYHDGYMAGEALFGEVPNTHQLVRQIDVAASGSYMAFVEIATGIIRKTDPRVEKLIDQWTITDDDPSGANASKIYREYLKERISETSANGECLTPAMLKWLGVDFRGFTLI